MKRRTVCTAGVLAITAGMPLPVAAFPFGDGDGTYDVIVVGV